MKETVRGPNYSAGFCEPDPYFNYNSGGRTTTGMTFARADAYTFQYKASDNDMKFIGHHSVGVEGPHARASCGVSTDGIDGMAQLSLGKVTSELGYVQAELNPNLTTGVSLGLSGFETRFGGIGGKVSGKGVSLHTPIGSFGVRSGIIPFFR